jgi:glycosyltransferase involved in cell wall biosynthesis
MRILHLSTQRTFYGGEVHLRDLAAGLRARGHDVQAIVRPDSQLVPRLAEVGVPAHPVLLVDWFEPRGMLALRSVLRRLQPDILHTHMPRDYYVAAAGTLGTSVLNVGTRHQLRPIAAPWLKGPFLRRFLAMIAVSDAVRDGLLASGLAPGRVVTVRNGVGEPEPRGNRQALRAELGLPPDGGPVVGFVGRLCPAKGTETLLHAVAVLRRSRPDLRLAIVGDDTDGGAYVLHLEKLAAELDLADLVSFCGYRADAARFSRAFDVQAVPSQAEPFGLVTLEAMVRGVPVVATAAGGSREIIHDGVDGLLVAPGDPCALAAGLEAVLADAALAGRLAAAGRERVRSSFTLDRQVAATEQVYRRLAPNGLAHKAEHVADHRHHAVDDQLDGDDREHQAHELLDDLHPARAEAP